MVSFGITTVFLAVSIVFGEDVLEDTPTTQKDDPVQIEFLLEAKNCERRTQEGDVVLMHYTGRLMNGNEFDSSVGKDPLKFRVGKGDVIKGMDEGIKAMCVGEKRRLTIPSSKGYGKEGAGSSIPPDSTLVFEVELMNILENKDDEPEPTDDGTAEEFFKQLDTNKDSILTKDEFATYVADLPEGEGGAPQDPKGQEEMTQQIFDQEDKNKDGKVTLEEFISTKHDDEL